MSKENCGQELHPEALHGIALFNAGKYFAAHEALENAWRAEPGPQRELYQAILQVAVTYLHLQRGNYAGALKVAARCQAKLDQWPAACSGLDLAGLRRNLTTVLAAAARLGPEKIHNFDQGLFGKIVVTRNA
jgi:predicted metal-dependent hydrolase